MIILVNASLPTILLRLISLLLSLLYLLYLNKLDSTPKFINTLYIYIYINIYYIILCIILYIQPLGYSAIVLYI